MAQASTFVRSALLKIQQVGAEQPIEQVDAQDTLSTFNDMMASWAGGGVNLGFTELTSLGDEVTVPAYANTAIKYNLAIAIADEYGRDIKAATAKVAKESYENMLHALISFSPVDFPSTLPVGSGNECTAYDRRFYNADSDQILTEENGSILVEDGTE